MANDLIRDSLTDQITFSHYIASGEKTQAFFESTLQKQGDYFLRNVVFSRFWGSWGSSCL
jgi:hypothetical protein